ncbi:hypothetical protein KM1_214770 [Entamoeba histolytica HM-3:IMSS]|uniref:Cysteine-rich surface protein n=5 Tax=Entamoeba histolytica TaxID=5759 RepID=C4MAD9_ENTH1|nr:hypothetical protein EHI_058920 [Entamoeba histolytica HM-1:IMSS]EMD47058.1 Hypothetical protein EHI5A_145790 [Entamoeba histolytica KU27]EMS17907.1 hypothetical protein KM1_214770 [Entamoeba histolytica HM-3:IMSS]ENY65597.1 hypothetical protein EHI7A_149250 [Entamoeba histolytica HM-1:IMSS-A]BAN38695.1 hypothetical protein [Entamoeba histolytica]EAL45867.1 hypothetical protein EHI_058920 [Entamoeba histolytica HM-1:IMSS]|eukprot:XP_651253.1 hypothetical protein EHI_058920 [Entamoeba histolytica HM-1:IMSS]
MNIIFICLLTGIVMSESIVISLIKNLEGNTRIFTSIEFGKCYYTGTVTSYYYTHNGNNITISHYNTTTCSGDKEEKTVDINDKEIKRFCINKDTCTIEIKEIPDYVGTFSFGIDDDTCSHRNNMYLTYVTGVCGKCSEIGETYCKYKEENGVMYSNVYSNNQCDETGKEFGEEMWKCGLCENGTMYKCGNKTMNQENSSDNQPNEKPNDQPDEKQNDKSEGTKNTESSSNNNSQTEDTSKHNSEGSKSKDDDSKNQTDEKSMNHSEDGTKGHSENSFNAQSDGNSKSDSEDASTHNIDSAPLSVFSFIVMGVILMI